MWNNPCANHFGVFFSIMQTGMSCCWYLVNGLFYPYKYRYDKSPKRVEKHNFMTILTITSSRTSSRIGTCSARCSEISVWWEWLYWDLSGKCSKLWTYIPPQSQFLMYEKMPGGFWVSWMTFFSVDLFVQICGAVSKRRVVFFFCWLVGFVAPTITWALTTVVTQGVISHLQIAKK